MNKLKTEMNQLQSIKITKAVLKGVSEGDKININYSPTMNVFNQNNIQEASLDNMEELMWTILESLPEPKLQNLKLLAVDTVIKKFTPYGGTMKKVGGYFNMQRTYMSLLKSKSLERKKLNASKVKSKELPIP